MQEIEATKWANQLPQSCTCLARSWFTFYVFFQPETFFTCLISLQISEIASVPDFDLWILILDTICRKKGSGLRFWLKMESWFTKWLRNPWIPPKEKSGSLWWVPVESCMLARYGSFLNIACVYVAQSRWTRIPLSTEGLCKTATYRLLLDVQYIHVHCNSKGKDNASGVCDSAVLNSNCFVSSLVFAFWECLLSTSSELLRFGATCTEGKR